MAKKVTAADLTLVPCNCEPGQSIGGGLAETEWHDRPKAVALAVKRHVLRVREGGHPYWCVHYGGGDGDAHAVSAVVDGLRYGPFGVGPA